MLTKIKYPDLWLSEKDLTEIVKITNDSFQAVRDNEHIKREDHTHRVVSIYTDGGCDDTRGPGGGGVHAFWYDSLTDEKIVRLDSNMSLMGYLSKSDGTQLEATLASLVLPQLGPLLGIDIKDKPMVESLAKQLKGLNLNKDLRARVMKTPLPAGYLDIGMPILEPASNNIAELVGAITGLEYALRVMDECDVQEVFMIMDSMYALNSCRNILKIAAKNYHSGRGEQLKNPDLLRKIAQIVSEIKSKDYLDRIKFMWIKGHSANAGNDRADDAANRAKTLAWRGVTKPYISIKGFAGTEKVAYKEFSREYWGVANNYNRFLCLTEWYVQANAKIQKDADGRFMIPMATAKDNKDGLEGKSESAVRNCIAYLKDMDPVLERVYDEQQRLHPDQCNDIYKIKLNRILSPKVYDDISKVGVEHTFKRGDNASMIHWTRANITSHLRPARIAYKEVDRLNALDRVKCRFLDMIRNKQETDGDYRMTDISDLVWEPKPETDGKKKAKKRKCLLTSADRILTFDAPLAGLEKKFKMRALIDMDVPPRNLMSSIADEDPKLYILTRVDPAYDVKGKKYYTFEYWYMLGSGDMEGDYCIWSAPNRNQLQMAA